jgi:tRNA pseudouridine38-40 synthase
MQMEAAIPPANLQRALNRTLPPAIRVLSAEFAAADFHARHSVSAKTYEYRIFRGEICPPWTARYVYALNWPLDIERMSRAASLVIGEHDFTSFAASDPDLSARRSDLTRQEPGTTEDQGNIRRIYSSGFSLHETEAGETLIYRVRGSGFLHHMVRNLVGTFLEAGRGLFSSDDIPLILLQRSRSAAGATAPARGLFLASVEY